MKNEIIEEVWKSKDELARQFEYDLDRLATALRQKEQEHGFKVVDFSHPSRADAPATRLGHTPSGRSQCANSHSLKE